MGDPEVFTMYTPPYFRNIIILLLFIIIIILIIANLIQRWSIPPGGVPKVSPFCLVELLPFPILRIITVSYTHLTLPTNREV